MTDVLLAQSQLASDRTLLPPLQQQLDVARHALSVLVGETPAQWSPPDFELEALALPAELPVILPSELIHQRPDILAAEAQLHAANAAVGVATALLYPNVNLSAAWTVERTVRQGAGLLDTTSLFTDLAGGLIAPLFHGGALEAQRRAAVAAFEAQLATYRQVVLLAFGQVADTLRALQNDAELLPTPARAPPSAEPWGEAACEAADSGGVLRPDSRPETPLRSPPRLTAIRPPQPRRWVRLCSVHGARPSLTRAAGEGLLSRQRSASVTRFVSRVAFHCRGRPARPAKRLEKRPRIYLLSAVGR